MSEQQVAQAEPEELLSVEKPAPTLTVDPSPGNDDGEDFILVQGGACWITVKNPDTGQEQFSVRVTTKVFNLDGVKIELSHRGHEDEPFGTLIAEWDEEYVENVEDEEPTDEAEAT